MEISDKDQIILFYHIQIKIIIEQSTILKIKNTLIFKLEYFFLIPNLNNNYSFLKRANTS
jgi:hypothetical protein